MKYSYYPGCSQERNALSYHISSMAVTKPLGVELEELDDWNCCGATEYFSLNALPAYAMVSRNLALAAPRNGGVTELVAPCSLCYINLSKTDHYMAQSKELNNQVNESLAAGGLSYEPGSVKPRHLLDVLVNDVGYDAIAAKVTKPLSGLRVAPYYGCLIVRPMYENAFDNPEYPVTLDNIMKAVGSEVVDFPAKAHCCGGHMTQISDHVAFDLIHRLLKSAVDSGADVIATVCPMCQLNLDVYQSPANNYFHEDFRIPVLYFTQLVGLAFGIEPNKLGIGKEFVDARPALSKIGVEIPVEEPTKRKAKKEGLPMPRMPEEG